MRRLRSSAAAVVLLPLLVALLGAPSPARAWTEARPAGLVTELAVDRDGGATVTLRIRWRVLAGRFRAFDLAELPADFALLEATATDATGSAVAVATRVPAPGRLELTLGEEGGGLRRGALDVVVRYTTSLRAQGAIRRSGDDAVLEIGTVPWERGLEAAELRVAVPASVRRAQWLPDETPGVDATVTSELGRDVVHAIRRHLPAGVRWTGRLACDPSLFAWLDRPTVAARAEHRVDRRSVLPAVLLALGLALALGGAARLIARARGSAAPIAPLPPRARALPVALAAAGGALQALALLRVGGAVTAGACVALAGLALGVPRVGRARALDASAPARIWPDARALATAREARGRAWMRALGVALVGAAIGLAVTAAVLRGVLLGIAAIDLALVGMAAIATTRRLHPRPDAALLAPTARALARALARAGAARVAWRVRGDGRSPGSVTVRVMPRPGHRFARGVRAIELRPVWRAGALVWRGTVELAVRAERGAGFERDLRLVVAQRGAGRVETSPDGDEVVLRAELVGPDRAALAAVLALMPRAIARVAQTAHARATAARTPDALASTDAISAERASAGTSAGASARA